MFTTDKTHMKPGSLQTLISVYNIYTVSMIETGNQFSAVKASL